MPEFPALKSIKEWLEAAAAETAAAVNESSKVEGIYS